MEKCKRCVTSLGNLLMSQTFKDFGQHPACLVGTSGLRQHSFLFAEKYNCMWAHSDIFRESAHDSLRTSVGTRDDSTILLLLLLPKQSLLHPQITFLVRRRGPRKWCHPYLTFPSFVSWSVSDLFYFCEREICTCLNYTPRRYRSGELAVWLPSGLLSLLWASDPTIGISSPYSSEWPICHTENLCGSCGVRRETFRPQSLKAGAVEKIEPVLGIPRFQSTFSLLGNKEMVR